MELLTLQFFFSCLGVSNLKQLALQGASGSIFRAVNQERGLHFFPQYEDESELCRTHSKILGLVRKLEICKWLDYYVHVLEPSRALTNNGRSFGECGVHADGLLSSANWQQKRSPFAIIDRFTQLQVIDVFEQFWGEQTYQGSNTENKSYLMETLSRGEFRKFFLYSV